MDGQTCAIDKSVGLISEETLIPCNCIRPEHNVEVGADF